MSGQFRAHVALTILGVLASSLILGGQTSTTDRARE